MPRVTILAPYIWDLLYEPIGGNPGYSRNPAVVEVFRIEFLLHFWIALEKSSPPMLSKT